MSKLSGIFAEFNDLDKIPLSDIIRWLPFVVNPLTLANFIGNRILYPQTIAISKTDLEIDLAILRELVRCHPEAFLNVTAHKIVIPQEFVYRFPPVDKLVLCLLEVLIPFDITLVQIKSEKGLETVGSVIKVPDLISNEPTVKLNGSQMTKLKTNALTLIPVREKTVRIQITGQEEMLVSGGLSGIIIDLRRGKT